MAAAVERILAAIRAAEPILIYGDYDVDGTTATVLLKTTIERIGLAMDPPRPAQVSYHVPHRIREGYGMQSSVLGAAASDGIRLVISVDTGIRAVAEAAEARRAGPRPDRHRPPSARRRGGTAGRVCGDQSRATRLPLSQQESLRRGGRVQAGAGAA